MSGGSSNDDSRRDNSLICQDEELSRLISIFSKNAESESQQSPIGIKSDPPIPPKGNLPGLPPPQRFIRRKKTKENSTEASSNSISSVNLETGKTDFSAAQQAYDRTLSALMDPEPWNTDLELLNVGLDCDSSNVER